MVRRRTGHSYLFKMMVSRTRCILYLYYAMVFSLMTTVECINSTSFFDFNNKIDATTPLVPKATVSVSYRESYHNNTKIPIYSSGNELWDGIIRDCLNRPSISCLQKNVHTYLDDTLQLSDVNVTNNFKFLKNKVDLYKYTKEANDHFEKENEIPDEEARSDSESPIEEVTDALSGKGIQFLMTHDIELKMPDVLFDGATFRISPRSFEGNGALVKLELIPKAIAVKQTGRILFKKIKKFFRNKLLLSFLAIVLVIKLIKIKIFWLLPLVVGVATAKKLMLKFVLFLFPALANIFKLCSYYHRNYHDTKYHHHQHHISHLHTVLPEWYSEPHNNNGPELIYTSPPKGHPSEYLHGGPPPHQHYQQDWELSGPGLGSEYIGDVHRNAHVSNSNSNFQPKVDDVNEINSWGLGTTLVPGPSHSNSNNVNNPFVKDATSRIINQPITTYNGPVYAPKKTASQIAAQYVPSQDPKIMREAQRIQAQQQAQQQALQMQQQQQAYQQAQIFNQQQQAQQQEAMRIQNEQRIVAQQQKILQQQPFIQDPSTTAALIDPFYSPILTKIDKIFTQLGFTDEPCRERLVCSMYKNPSKFSPHSNFISAELSRDSAELNKPAQTNVAVIRFYRYVQAARDGQDQRDCLRLYSQCLISTEK